MIPKVGQLLKWYDNFDFDNNNNDVGIVKAVHTEEVEWEHQHYTVIVDWCKGPHHSYHEQDEWEESLRSSEIVLVE
tara:strand:+ start:715 stop:942 length:228 start_codon:yes stop_codon:yes gene_type:complete